MGPSIYDVGNWEVSKIGPNCQRIVLKTVDMGEGGVRNLEKLPTSFMDGPLTETLNSRRAKAHPAQPLTTSLYLVLVLFSYMKLLK